MNVSAALAAGRAAAESLMTLTLTAYSPSKGTVGNVDTTVYTAEGMTAGKVQGNSVTGKDPVSRTVRVGNVDRPVIEGGLHIPLDEFVGVDGLAIVASDQRGTAWEFVVTDAGDGDPALAGRRYMVTNCPTKSYATARRLDVVEVPAP